MSNFQWNLWVYLALPTTVWVLGGLWYIWQLRRIGDPEAPLSCRLDAPFTKGFTVFAVSWCVIAGQFIQLGPRTMKGTDANQWILATGLAGFIWGTGLLILERYRANRFWGGPAPWQSIPHLLAIPCIGAVAVVLIPWQSHNAMRLIFLGALFLRFFVLGLSHRPVRGIKLPTAERNKPGWNELDWLEHTPLGSTLLQIWNTSAGSPKTAGLALVRTVRTKEVPPERLQWHMAMARPMDSGTITTGQVHSLCVDTLLAQQILCWCNRPASVPAMAVSRTLPPISRKYLIGYMNSKAQTTPAKVLNAILLIPVIIVIVGVLLVISLQINVSSISLEFLAVVFLLFLAFLLYLGWNIALCWLPSSETLKHCYHLWLHSTGRDTKSVGHQGTLEFLGHMAVVRAIGSGIRDPNLAIRLLESDSIVLEFLQLRGMAPESIRDPLVARIVREQLEALSPDPLPRFA